MKECVEYVYHGVVSPAWASVQISLKISVCVACFFKNLGLD